MICLSSSLSIYAYIYVVPRSSLKASYSKHNSTYFNHLFQHLDHPIDMQLSSVFYLFACLATVKAAPLQCRSSAEGCLIVPGLIIFHGAAGAQYSLNVPLDGKPVYTSLFTSLAFVLFLTNPR